jgi:hypothetical protein
MAYRQRRAILQADKWLEESLAFNTYVAPGAGKSVRRGKGHAFRLRLSAPDGGSYLPVMTPPKPCSPALLEEECFLCRLSRWIDIRTGNT